MSRIVIATGLYTPEIGGPATYTALLEECLPAQGIDVVTVPFGSVRSYPKFIRHVVYLIKLWLASKDATTIYALDAISVGVPAWLVSVLRRKTFIIRLGGDYAWEQGRIRFGVTETLDEFVRNKSRRHIFVYSLAWIQTFVTKQASKVIAPSHYLKQIIESWGVPTKNIEVIHSAFSPVVVNEEREALRTQFDFAYPTLVSAGRLVPWKGFATLITTLEKLILDYREATLVIAGEGPLDSELRNLIIKKGLGDHVRMVGPISKETLSATIKAADVFVLNTAYEGLSHQLLEVMYLETPLVTTDIGGNREIILDGVSGRLTRFDDVEGLKVAIAATLEQIDKTKQIVAAAKNKSKEFIGVDMINRLILVLRSNYERR